MSGVNGLKNARFRRVTEQGGDCCLFCESRKIDEERKQICCRLHNVILGRTENFGSGEYVCDCFQESAWVGEAADLLSDSPQNKSTSSYSGKDSVTNKEGCYIATAVYGGYDEWEVMVLRKYRDTVLRESILGRMFIKVYYTISPFLAEKLKKNSFMNKRVKRVLDQLVRKINEKFNFSEI